MTLEGVRERIAESLRTGRPPNGNYPVCRMCFGLSLLVENKLKKNGGGEFGRWYVVSVCF